MAALFSRRRMVMGTAAAILSPGCATVFGKPVPKGLRDKKRLRWGFVILDLLWVVTIIGIPLFGAFLIIDFATGAIYQRWEYRSPLPDDYEPPDPDDDEKELDPPPDMAHGAWLDVAPVPVCDEAKAVLLAGGPEKLRHWGRWLARMHLEDCPTCQRAVASRGRRQRVFVDDPRFLEHAHTG